MAIHYGTEENFDQLTRNDFTIVDFFSTTCVPCKLFSKILESIEAELPFVNIVKVNISDAPELGQRFEIQAVPTIHFYKDGAICQERIGVIPEDELREIIAGFLY